MPQKGLCAATVSHFPEYFGGYEKANLQRASRYWRGKDRIIERHTHQTKHNGHYFVRATATGLKAHAVKAAPGRGRPKSAWCISLSAALLEDFDRLRKAGVKINTRLLRVMTLRLIEHGTNEEYGLNVVDPRSGHPIKNHVTKRWIQHFMQSNKIVSRSQTGKLMVSPAKQELIEREVAFHLGSLKRDFDAGVLNEADIYKADETHFCIDQHDHRTLSRRSDSDVKYADVVSGDDGMTMMVLIGGVISSSVLPPFMILKNEERSYPIRNVPDNSPGVSYRTQPKAWMDHVVFYHWLNEIRALPPVPPARKRVLFLDNCSSHAMMEEVIETFGKTRTEVRFLPANATDLCQPADPFAIQKIEAVWRARWDAKKLSMIEQNMWVDPRKGSGKLVNPEKRTF